MYGTGESSNSINERGRTGISVPCHTSGCNSEIMDKLRRVDEREREREREREH